MLQTPIENSLKLILQIFRAQSPNVIQLSRRLLFLW